MCTTFISQINDALVGLGETKLSLSQRTWLSLCITGIIITNSVCWKRFERAGFGKFCAGTLSKMFRRGKIPWDELLKASILNIFQKYNITEGVLALDGTDNRRSKSTKTIASVHKIKDKTSGGFIKGQELTILVLITHKVTVPVGFSFYEPDPAYTAWKKQEKSLKKQGIPKKDRPIAPEKNADYPTTIEVALKLLREFAVQYPKMKIKAILADALYGAKTFVKPASKMFGGVQVVSQIKKNQKVKVRGKYISVKEYFTRNPGVSKSLKIRGGTVKAVVMHGARLHLKAHGCKRFIIALKYAGETEYRYLVASDLTWRLTDIAAAYTLRWLVEVFIQDWKGYEGWCQLAKQPGIDGSRRGVILSLLLDHCLLLHPDQMALINNKLPAATVGSLRDRERAKAVLEAIESLVNSKDAAAIIPELQKCINDAIPLRVSEKHMNTRDLGRLEPTPSLKYKAAA